MRLARGQTEIGNVADLTVRGAIALLAAPLDSFASKAADQEIETLDLAAAELASAERAVRYNAYRDCEAALEQIIELGGNTSAIGQAVWEELGSQLNAAIAHCTETIKGDLKEPFPLSKAATASILDAREIALEMLRRVRNGAEAAP
jgi:hypothetical protein